MVEENLKKLILEKFGSLRNFAIKIDLPYTTLDSIMKRGISNSNVANVIKICKGLNISPDKLIDERQIINFIEFDNAEKCDTDSNIIKIPVLGVIKAGTPIEAQEDVIDYIEIPTEWTKGNKKFYGLLINGDSMYPKYQEKDIVIFEQNDDMQFANGKDCAIMVNGFDATFKRFNLNEDGVTLTPLNIENSDGYTTTFYNIEQVQSLPVRVIGIAKQIRRNI